MNARMLTEDERAGIAARYGVALARVPAAAQVCAPGSMGETVAAWRDQVNQSHIRRARARKFEALLRREGKIA